MAGSGHWSMDDEGRIYKADGTVVESFDALSDAEKQYLQQTYFKPKEGQSDLSGQQLAQVSDVPTIEGEGSALA